MIYLRCFLENTLKYIYRIIFYRKLLKTIRAFHQRYCRFNAIIHSRTIRGHGSFLPSTSITTISLPRRVCNRRIRICRLIYAKTKQKTERSRKSSVRVRASARCEVPKLQLKLHLTLAEFASKLTQTLSNGGR